MILPVWVTLSLSDNERNLLERLFMVYERNVYHLSMQILHNHADAEDNTIQTFEKLSKVLNQIEQDIKSPRNYAFIYTIAQYAALDMVKHEKIIANYTRLQATETYITSTVFEDLSYFSLIDAMKQINPLDTEIMLLKYVFGLKSKEIAGAVGISKANVDTRLHRAKEQMRQNPKIQEYKGGMNW